MPVIGDAIKLFDTIARMISYKVTSPNKRYDEACSIARDRAEQDAAHLRLDLLNEEMMIPSALRYTDRYFKKFNEKEAEINKYVMERYDFHLNNILETYKLKHN
jgi:hypothetical protein